MQLTKSQKVFLNKAVYRGTWTLNSEGKVDIDGDVRMVGVNLTEIPVKFNKVSGNFNCSFNLLTSLEFAPSKVGGGFYCHNNYQNLTSLEGAPSEVGGDFYCFNNHLTSLEFAPSSVGEDFYCSHNNLTSLEFAPSKVGGIFNCSNNPLKNYFKNIKEEEFKHWDVFVWSWVLEEYPFLINIAKNYVDKEDFIDLIKMYPKTKLYLR
jgi:hypothetical protein